MEVIKIVIRHERTDETEKFIYTIDGVIEKSTGKMICFPFNPRREIKHDLN